MCSLKTVVFLQLLFEDFGFPVLHRRTFHRNLCVKLKFSKKATKIDEILTIDLTLTT